MKTKTFLPIWLIWFFASAPLYQSKAENSHYPKLSGLFPEGYSPGRLVDNDGDGFDHTVDCNDYNASVYPNAPELCDGLDNDCDNLADEGLPQFTYFLDSDGDGFGNYYSPLNTCASQVPAGYSANPLDCNDYSSSVAPFAPEICNGWDEDCDGQADDGLTFITYYADWDGDGFGYAGFSQISCSGPPPGYVANDEDCDLYNPNLYPGAPEICNGFDEDCDGQPDNGLPFVTYYYDYDGDGYGNSWYSSTTCDGPPAGYVSNDDDCNDWDPDIHPGAAEICNGWDEDCDGQADDGLLMTYWYDNDQDGFGDPNYLIQTCQGQPSGTVSNGGDCDDWDASVYPGSLEICNGKDDDCDGAVNEGFVVYYYDWDGDGYGNVYDFYCGANPPPGYVNNYSDCFDWNAAIHPGAAEVCDGGDDDCDGQADDGLPFATYYYDSDGDGYGQSWWSTTTCDGPPAGFVSNDDDCFDWDANTFPGAAEICNGWDDDCDGQADDGLPFATYYHDSDGDGYGNAGNSTTTCDGPPAGYVSNDDDCTDWDANTFPGAAEVCNYNDDDCDGLTDEGLNLYYYDADQDGYGDPNNWTCSGPTPGYVSNNLDCDDWNSNFNPLATDICDQADNNCDGLVDDGTGFVYYYDFDGDGYGSYYPNLYSCTPLPNFVTNHNDCNDLVAAISPGATEICNSIDDDCDALIDDSDPSITGQPLWYADNDQDGYGNPQMSSAACIQPAGYVSSNSDCHDGNAAVNPAAQEICNNIDDDCDQLTDDADPSVTGQPTWYADLDQDGYGNNQNTALACVAPANFIADNSDCHDGNAAVNPAAQEICNNIDDDCDQLTDDADPSVTGQPTWYADNDQDGYGNANAPLVACFAPQGYVSDNTDCDDNNGSVNPGASEMCNGGDDNCNGSTDEGVLLTFFGDSDQDGFGDPGVSTQACSAPAGYVADNTDCNDNNGSVNPGASEVCNGIDDNCNGSTDEGVLLTFYADNDQDGFGNPLVSLTACTPPSGYVNDNSDCNDGNAAIHPAVQEICNNVDDDCDQLTDDADPSVTGQSSWFADSDQDGFGDAQSSVLACFAPSGHVADNTDCNDLVAGINPGATENLCNGTDDNCNGQVDEGALATTQLDQFSCGVTVAHLGHVLRANHMPGAVQYEFEFSDGVNTYYELRPNRGFYFSLFSWSQFGTTYTVRVRWFNGNIWSCWGPPCSVSIAPSMPTTQLDAASCGAYVSDPSQVLRAIKMFGAIQYEFEFFDGTSTYYEIRPNQGFYFSLFNWDNFNTTYSVRVRWTHNGVDWSQWGPSCPVTVGPMPLTQLQAGDCGSTVTSWTQVLRANAMSGAIQYEFKVSNGSNTWYLLRPNRGFYFKLFGLPAGSFPAGNYTVEIRWKDGGTGQWSPWGPTCNLTLPSPLSEEIEEAEGDEFFNVRAFPVPFTTVVNLEVETFSEEPVGITVLDINGRMIESRQVQMENNGLLTLGQDWAAGVYAIRVEQGTEVRTLRVVKANR